MNLFKHFNFLKKFNIKIFQSRRLLGKSSENFEHMANELIERLTQVVLVIRERADPIGRGRRQVTALRVQAEHRNRLRKRRAPSVAYEPFRRLRLRCGDEIHKTALVRLREGFDEILVDGVHLQILPGQALLVQGTFFERLYDLHLLHYVLDEGPEIGHLSRCDGALRGVLDRRAAEQIVLGHLDATLPRS